MKHLLTYFLLTYLISWIIWLPLYGHVFGQFNLFSLPFHHGIGGPGPLIAAFLTTWIFYKNDGVRSLLNRCFKIRPLLYLSIAFLSPFILVFIAALTSYLIDKTPFNLHGLVSSKEFPTFNLRTFFIYNLIFFGLGEEIGWRGFALPRLQAKTNALTSSIILTGFWAIWHLPLFFYRPGYMTMDIVGILGWLFSLLTGSVLLTWLYNSSRGSILACAVFHSTIDIAFTADIADKNIIVYLGFLITMWGILTVMIFKPKTISTTGEKITITDNLDPKIAN